MPCRALRRRYGIPDDDQRPFAIAYAAARARTDEGSDDGNREASEQPEDGRLPTRRGHSGTPMLVRRRVDGEDAARASVLSSGYACTHRASVQPYTSLRFLAALLMHHTCPNTIPARSFTTHGRPGESWLSYSSRTSSPHADATALRLHLLVMQSQEIMSRCLRSGHRRHCSPP